MKKQFCKLAAICYLPILKKIKKMQNKFFKQTFFLLLFSETLSKPIITHKPATCQISVSVLGLDGVAVDGRVAQRGHAVRPAQASSAQVRSRVVHPHVVRHRIVVPGHRRIGSRVCIRLK